MSRRLSIVLALLVAIALVFWWMLPGDELRAPAPAAPAQTESSTSNPPEPLAPEPLAPELGAVVEPAERESASLPATEAAPVVDSAQAGIDSGGTFAGVVVDQYELIVAGLEIWLAPSSSEAARFFQPHESPSIVAKTESDAAGRFAFRDVPPGSWSIGPGAGSLGQPTHSEIASQATRFEMTAAETRDITLRVYRAIYISGRVLDPAGEPQPKAFVWAFDASRSGLQANCEEEGLFVLGPLVPGRYTLIALCGAKLAPSDPVEASSGQEGVELRLRAGGSMSGRVVDASTGQGSQAELRVSPLAGGRGWDEHGIGWTSHEDGTFEMEGLPSGLYGVSAGTVDGRFGVLRGVGVSAGAGTGELVVAVSPGGKLRLRYEGQRPEVECAVRFQGVFVGWGEKLKPGAAVTRFAPAGTLSLVLRIEGGPELSTRTVELGVSEEKEIVFRDGE